MTFSIDKFKSAIDKYGGVSRNNKFEVQFSPVSNDPLFNERDLVFFCQTVVMPGVSFSVFDYRPTSIEMPQSIPFTMNTEQLECVFIVDNDNRVYDYFYNWMRRVINFTGNETEVGHLPYEIGYKKDYAKSMTISKYASSSESYIMTVEGVYPTAIGSTSLSWNDSDSYTVLPVTLSYSRLNMPYGSTTPQ